MDLKGVVRTLNPVEVQKNAPVDRTIKSEGSHDRDGNGQMPSGGGQQHPPMSDEQFQKAIEHLKAHAVVKEHNLEVVIKDQNGQKIIYIQEQSGKVLRRIFEEELWSLITAKDNEKGQLLSRAA